MGGEDHFFSSGGLRLHGRLYRGGAKTPAICIPGLTRNERDFSEVGPFLAETGRDVFAVSLRGRGLSDRDPDFMNYRPPTYVGDVLAALDSLGWRKAVFVGTSLGGLVTMLTNERAGERVAGAVINDIGPELAPEGIARIAGYVGGEAPPPAETIDDAATQIRAINEVAFPGRDASFWRLFATRTFRRRADGRYVLDYDRLIGRALVEAEPVGDLWPVFKKLEGKPTLVTRGTLSDLLTPPILQKMRAAVPDMRTVDIPNVGHAPTLSEPDAARAMTDFVGAL